MEQIEFWDRRSDKYDRNIRGDRVFALILEKTRTRLDDSDAVLDVGCATGEIALEVAQSVKHVQGIDTSTVMIDKARRKTEQRDIHNVAFDSGDVTAHSLARDSYHKVFAFNVLHLVGDAGATIKSMHDLLYKGGYVLSGTPCLGERSWLFRLLIAVFVRIGMAPPVEGLSYRKLKQIFTQNSFDIIEEDILGHKDRVLWLVAKKR
jgi:2-polyprenyl-3-methyl-5-hydroxy-6-metoxy-1,4-benzoquinol methylase